MTCASKTEGTCEALVWVDKDHHIFEVELANLHGSCTQPETYKLLKPFAKHFNKYTDDKLHFTKWKHQLLIYLSKNKQIKKKKKQKSATGYRTYQFLDYVEFQTRRGPQDTQETQDTISLYLARCIVHSEL